MLLLLTNVMVPLEILKHFCKARFTSCQIVRNTTAASWNLSNYHLTLACNAFYAVAPDTIEECMLGAGMLNIPGLECMLGEKPGVGMPYIELMPFMYCIPPAIWWQYPELWPPTMPPAAPVAKLYRWSNPPGVRKKSTMLDFFRRPCGFSYVNFNYFRLSPHQCSCCVVLAGLSKFRNLYRKIMLLFFVFFNRRRNFLKNLLVKHLSERNFSKIQRRIFFHDITDSFDDSLRFRVWICSFFRVTGRSIQNNNHPLKVADLPIN